MDDNKAMVLPLYERNLGIQIEDYTAGKIRISMMIQDKLHTNPHGKAHGGILMSLADTAMGAACYSLGKSVVTLEMNINYIKSVPAGEIVYAVGEVLHNGGHTLVAECSLMSDKGKIYAKSRGTFYVIDKFTE